LHHHHHHERSPSLSAPLLRHQHSHSDSFDSDKGGSSSNIPPVPATFYSGGGDMNTDSPESASNGETDLGEFGYRFPVTHPQGGDGGRENKVLSRKAAGSSSMAGIGSAARTTRHFEPLSFNATSTTGAGAASPEGDNRWSSSPSSVSKKPSSPRQGELIVPFPSSPPPPPPPPLSDEFDPYRELSSGS